MAFGNLVVTQFVSATGLARDNFFDRILSNLGSWALRGPDLRQKAPTAARPLAAIVTRLFIARLPQAIVGHNGHKGKRSDRP